MKSQQKKEKSLTTIAGPSGKGQPPKTKPKPNNIKLINQTKHPMGKMYVTSQTPQGGGTLTHLAQFPASPSDFQTSPRVDQKRDRLVLKPKMFVPDNHPTRRTQVLSGNRSSNAKALSRHVFNYAPGKQSQKSSKRAKQKPNVMKIEKPAQKVSIMHSNIASRATSPR